MFYVAKVNVAYGVQGPHYTGLASALATTEHSMSSYGLPVVRANGAIVNPADDVTINIGAHRPKLAKALQMAGYFVQTGWLGDATEPDIEELGAA